MDIKNYQKDYQVEIDLQKYWLVLKRRWLPASIAFSTVAVLGTILSLLQKPVFESEGRLLFKVNSVSSLTALGDRKALETLGRLEPVDNKSSLVNTQAEIFRSNSIVQETILALGLVTEDGKLLERETFIKNLTVKGVAETDILQVAYKANNPELAAAVVNKLMEVFLRKNIQANRAEPLAAREFIKNQLPVSEAAVEQASMALRRFKEKNGIVVLNEEASKTVSSISGINDRISEVRSELADVTARSKKLQSQIRTNPQQAVLYATISQSPGVQDVLNQLQKVQRELAVQQTRFRGGPLIDNLEKQVVVLENLLQQRVAQLSGSDRAIPVKNLQSVGDTEEELVSKLVESEMQRVGLMDRLNTLLDVQTAYKQRANTIPALEQEQRALERKLDAAQKTYTALLTRMQEVQVAENQAIGNARIISEANVPKKPATSTKKLIFAASILAAALLAVMSAFAIDLLDRSIKTLKETKEIFGYVLLGVIPTVSNNPSQKSSIAGGLEYPIPHIYLREGYRSSVAEAFQMLKANLKFLGLGKPLKTIAIASSVAAEGKSFVAANLAATVAQSGQRVLLVDADLRRPVQHHIWDRLSSVGLSNLIVEQFSMKEVLQEVMPNLFLLPAGVIPPNPTALLDSQRMVSLIDTFSKSYDLVIFDTPPLAGKADAAVLGKAVDGVLLVVRPGVADYASAKAAKEFLTQSGQTVLGMVANGVNANDEPDSYFYYTEEKEHHSTSKFNLVKHSHLRG